MALIVTRLLIFTLLLSSAAMADKVSITGRTMGTYFSVLIDAAESTLDQTQLKQSIETRLSEINRQMSTWDADSEISKFNRSESTEWFEVSAEFAAVVEEAIRIHKLTNGAFDPTVAPLIDLWGFGDDRKKSVPDEAAVNAALGRIGMQHIQVRDSPPALKKSIPDVQLNLSAIAKGYGVDAIARLLSESGLGSFVVDIGGENRTGLPKADGSPWRIGIESPTGGELHRVVELTSSSIATSGDYRNNFRVEDVVYSHAISPITGRPVENPPASVSVIAESCMTADALATAFMVLDPDKGIALAKTHGLSVMYQHVQKDGSVKSNETGLFNKVVAADATESTSSDDTGSASDTTAQPDSANNSTAKWFPFAAAAVVFLIAVAGMGIGAMIQNKSLKGSCGGLAAMPGGEGQSICEMCTIPKDECTNAELREKMQEAAVADGGKRTD